MTMKKILAVLSLWVMPFFAYAACNINIPDPDLKSMVKRLQEHAESINTISEGYKGLDSSEGMWLRSLSANIGQVQDGLFRLRDIVYIRDSISGNENQKIVREVLTNALAVVSERASINKDYFLKVSSAITNQAAASEVSQAILIFKEVIYLGDTCPKGR